MNEKLFPLRDTSAKQYARLKMYFHPIKKLTEADLTPVAHLLQVPTNALFNNYRHHGDRVGVAPFECTPMSRLKQPEPHGSYCVGLTILPTALLRYGQVKAELVRDLNEASKGVCHGLMARSGWHDQVKTAYGMMLATAERVKAAHKGKPARAQLTYFDFPGLYVAVHESLLV